jgi:hypothetical protein
MRRVTALCTLVGAALVLTACNGGTVDRHALTNDAATIDSINCESWLLAQAAARDRLTAVYTREQAAVLHQQASNLADALATRPTADGLHRRVRMKAREAATLARRLNRLHADPTARSTATVLAGRFKRAGRCS